MTAEPLTLLLAKATLILLAGVALDALLRHRSALASSTAWNGVLLVLAALPLANELTPRWNVPLLPAIREVVEAPLPSADPVAVAERPQPDVRPRPIEPQDLPLAPATVAPIAVAPTNTFDVTISFRGAILGVYLLGAGVMLARMAWAVYAERKLRRGALILDHGPWADGLQRCRTTLGMAFPVRLLLTDRVAVPCAFGLRDAAIAIPARLAATAERSTIDSVLLHELAHLARRDLGWLWLQRLVEAVLWFHPLVWLASRRIAFIRERACDEFVVHALGDSRAYALTLVDLATHAGRSKTLACGLAVVRSSNLSRRVDALLNSRGNPRFAVANRVWCPLAAAALLATIGLASIDVVGGDVSAQPPAPGALKEAGAAVRTEKAALPKEKGEIEVRYVTNTITGRALDIDGKPIAGATIYLVCPEYKIARLIDKTETDNEGRYEFRDARFPFSVKPQGEQPEASSFEVFGISPTHAFSWSGLGIFIAKKRDPNAFVIFADGPNFWLDDRIEIDLKFAPKRKIEGRFIKDDGQPIAGVKVRMLDCDRLDSNGRYDRGFYSLLFAANLLPNELQTRAESDAQGHFEFPSVPLGVLFRMAVAHPGYSSYTFYTCTSDDPPAEHERQGAKVSITPLPLVFKLSSRTIRLQVRSHDTGTPLESFNVFAFQGQHGVSSSGTTDKNGWAELQLPVGEYRVCVDPPFQPKSDADYIRTYDDLHVKPAPKIQFAAVRQELACRLILKAINAATGKGIPNVVFMSDGELFAQKSERVVVGSDGYRTNDKGQLSVFVSSGRRSYRPSQHNGYEYEDEGKKRELETSPTKPVTAEFRFRKKPEVKPNANPLPQKIAAADLLPKPAEALPQQVLDLPDGETVRATFQLPSQEKMAPLTKDFLKPTKADPGQAKPVEFAPTPKAAANEPTTARAYWSRGMDHNSKKRYAEALADYTKAIDLDPKYDQAYFSRSSLYSGHPALEKREYAKAAADLTKYLDLKPKDFSARFNRALCYESLREYDKAIADYTQVIDGDTDFSRTSDGKQEGLARTYHYRGRAYQWYKDDNGKAVADYTEALRFDPKMEMVHYRRGQAHHELKEYGKAQDDYAEALKRHPSYSNLLVSWAWQMATCPDPQFRDGKKALELARKANDPNTLAAAYAEVGRFEEAVKAQKKAIENLVASMEEERKSLQERLKISQAGQHEEQANDTKRRIELLVPRADERRTKMQAALKLYEAGTPFRTK